MRVSGSWVRLRVIWISPISDMGRTWVLLLSRLSASLNAPKTRSWFDFFSMSMKSMMMMPPMSRSRIW